MAEVPASFQNLLTNLEKNNELFVTKINTLNSILSALYVKLGKPGYTPIYERDWAIVGFMRWIMDDIRTNVMRIETEIRKVKPKSEYILFVDRYMKAVFEQCKIMGEGKFYLSKAFYYLWVALDDAGF